MCLHLSQCATWQLFPLAWLQVFWEMTRKLCTGCWHIQGPAQTSLLLRGLSVSTEFNMYSRLACLMSNINTLIKVTTRYLLYSNVSFVQLICKMALHFLTINSISTYWVPVCLVLNWTLGKVSKTLRRLALWLQRQGSPTEKRDNWALEEGVLSNAERLCWKCS